MFRHREAFRGASLAVNDNFVIRCCFIQITPRLRFHQISISVRSAVFDQAKPIASRFIGKIECPAVDLPYQDIKAPATDYKIVIFT
jgi:hypothetical protein